ncbi:MAG: LysR substrate-binding domain-containing protein [Methylomonas sp.]|jgi:LysR family hydrogen peroxide-inducible transcriptional activator|uniref:LysR substrate-binding domain-containing protein n=1 Tax=Methylomonas sp. TaxID=418 RepID=UPI0025F98C54|nr:LysR substrate-binding domain-containing protein [Methylomonas sp.]MCK9606181.1 LysR substrate-binding domain-containing protein [Methylomonas sp.]
MNLRDLRYLIAVAELRSFVQASEHCHISQPTLSTQIKKLEDRLGVQIFERNNKRVLATEVGEHIIATARRILKEVDHMQDLAETARDPLAGNLRIGAFPTLSTYIFPALVPLIRDTLPRIRLILVEAKTEELVRRLKNGQIDMALLAMPVGDDFLQTQALFDDEFLLAVAADHPLADANHIRQQDLSGQQLLLLDEGHCLRGHALQICRLNGAEEQQDVRATGLETLRQMVRAGTGITFMPRIAIREPDQGIRYIPFQAPAPSRSIGLVWRKTSMRSRLLDEIGRLIVRAARQPAT